MRGQESRAHAGHGCGVRRPARTARAALHVGGDGSSDVAAPPDLEGRVGDATGPTPPGPPFKSGPNVLVPPGVDPAGAGVEEDQACAAPSSLLTAVCLPPPARPIGLVGPMSNFAAPTQLVENVPYRDADEMQAFARRWRDEHRKQWFTVPSCRGFVCF